MFTRIFANLVLVSQTGNIKNLRMYFANKHYIALFGRISFHFGFSFTDWYYPKPDWSQNVLPEDAVEDTINILALGSPHPTADTSALCTIMMNNNPHGSFNWAKIPCDYPIFRTGLICKKKAENYKGKKS